MLDQSLSDRLKSKSVRQSIIGNLSKDFNLTPILAEAYFSQISEYFLHHAEVSFLPARCSISPSMKTSLPVNPSRCVRRSP